MTGGAFGGCATCVGQCCRRYLVPVTAADVGRIVAATALHPAEFLALHEVTGGRRGFRLDPAGPPHLLVLDQREAPDQSCVFLMELPGGHGRCGAYAARPLACRTFPMVLRHGTAALRPDTPCGPTGWNLAAMDLSARRRQLREQAAAWGVHARVVAEWNAMVDAGGAPRSPAQLFRFLLENRPDEG